MMTVPDSGKPLVPVGRCITFVAIVSLVICTRVNFFNGPERSAEFKEFRVQLETNFMIISVSDLELGDNTLISEFRYDRREIEWL